MLETVYVVRELIFKRSFLQMFQTVIFRTLVNQKTKHGDCGASFYLVIMRQIFSRPPPITFLDTKQSYMMMYTRAHLQTTDTLSFKKTEKYILAVMNDSSKQSYDNRELSIFAEDREKKALQISRYLC